MLHGRFSFLGLFFFGPVVADISPKEVTQTVNDDLRQVLVFDAGSSGTRIHVFNLWPSAKGSAVPRIDLNVRDQQTKKIKPGLSSFAEAEDLDGVQKNIEQLLEFGNQFVPATRRGGTPALLKATAGLRAVKPESKATAILGRVRETLAKSGYLFKTEWADIIKGKEEAGLAWVAANYLKGTFDASSSSLRGGSTSGSLGIIEMGGGSTQVSFEVSPQEASKLNDLDSFIFTPLVGTPYHLYAHSYLGYGMDAAQAKVQTALPSSEETDPCYPVGYFRKENDKLVAGKGDATSCQRLIKDNLFSSEPAAPGKYDGELSPRGAFAATENFFYIRNDLKLELDGNIDSMQDAASKSCLADPPKMLPEEADMKAGKANSKDPKHCFGLSFQVALIEALKIPTIAGVKVDIARQINGGDLDWAMGAAVKHFIDNGSAAPALGLSLPSVSPGMVGLVVLVSFGVVAAVTRYAWKTGACPQQVKSVQIQMKTTAIGKAPAAAE